MYWSIVIIGLAASSGGFRRDPKTNWDFVKEQLARQPDRAWLSRMLLLGFGGVWALLAVVLLMLTR
jgi:hypothetical protein